MTLQQATRVEWDENDCAQALQQGWAIFATSHDDDIANQIVKGKPYGHRPYELQAVDEEGAFVDDEEAHTFVREAVNSGDPLAMRAAAYLQLHSPVEYDALMAH